jgi:hypothetical protein
MNTTKIEFTEVGKEFLRTDADTQKVLKEAKELKWQSIADGLTVGMMPGMGIKAAIKEFGIPKVDEVAIGGGFGLSCEPSAGFGFYGIHGHYKNADVKIYILDDGVSCTPLFTEVTNKV